MKNIFTLSLKKVLIGLVFLSGTFAAHAQNVNIPDPIFKAALTSNLAINTNADGEIQVSEAVAYNGNINLTSLGISDLTGIEAFVNISNLVCLDNNLNSIDISANINLTTFNCAFNNITNIDVSTNILLDYLFCYNNQLTSIDLSNNPSIIGFSANNNNITNLDLSSNSNLAWLEINNNDLVELNIQNGNNSNLFTFDATNNPSLTCIQVDDPTNMNTFWSAGKDASATYNTTCGSCVGNVNIPDPIFKAALVANDLIDTNFDDEIQCSEAAAYSGLIDVSYQGISDLTGIEAFSSLTDLDCSGNSIASLNLSGNTSLSWLQCIANNMTSINVTNCPNLSFFNCGNNLITTIDVSNNPLIQQLWAFGNQLTNLDLSNNNNILSLELNDNQLTNIDVSNLLNLNDFRCANNNITTLDLSNNTLLSTIVVFNNSALTSLNLKNIDVFAIGFLNATGNTNLGCVSVDDVANFNANWSTAIDGITTYNFNCDAFVNIPDGVFKTALTTNSVINPNLDGDITFGEAAAYTGSITVNNLGISDLTGIEAFVNITSLVCSNNSLSTLDLTSNSKLQSVDCSFNNLTTFATPLTNALTDLNCSNNQISSIFLDDVSGLVNFDCSYNNNLTSISLIQNNNLQTLNISHCDISTLDLSSNSSLTQLRCASNQLSFLNLNDSPLLIYVDCSDNSIGGIDITSLPNLIYFDCSSNPLTDIDISSNNNLTNLYINYTGIATVPTFNNPATVEGLGVAGLGLTAIDISIFPAINKLICANNNLSTIDFSANPDLGYFICNNNNLTSLDFSTSLNLYNLDCSDNALTSLSVKNGTFTTYDGFDATNNPALTCIEVDDVAYFNTTWSAGKDAGASYNTVCSPCLVNIPDAIFKAALVADLTINTNADAEIQCAEAIAYTGSIVVNNLGIADLTGIEAFVNITGGLYCQTNLLTSIDVSANTALTVLDCRYNDITSLDVSANTALTELRCFDNQITSLNVSSNLALTLLSCGVNPINSLDVSANTALTVLDAPFNNLTTLDVSANTLLTNLSCNNNQLLSIDVSNNPALQFFACNNNLFSGIDVSNNPNLNYFYCNGNSISALDVSNNPLLLYLDCSSNNLNTIDVSNNPLVYQLFCSFNNLTALDLSANNLGELRCFNNNIISIDLSNSTNLYGLYCNDNQLTSLNIQNGNNSNINAFNATNNPALTCILVSDEAFMNTNFGNLFNKDAIASYSTCCSGIVNIPDANFKNALVTNLAINTNADAEIQCGEAIAYTSIIDVSNQGITDLTGIEAFINIVGLNFYDNNVSSVDISANSQLNFLGCSNNQLSVLDISNNPILNSIICENNNLTTLDVTSNPFLSTLNVRNNNITTLDLTNNLNMVNLECYDNQISTLNLSNMSLLESLGCGLNQLTNLDISANPQLTYLECNDNLITSLNLSNNLALTNIYCSNNQITSLDVSNHTSLLELFCSSNQIATLNVNNCPLLNTVACLFNQITSLDFSGQPLLVSLYCAGNQLTNLNIQNGNNSNLNDFTATINPALTCIQVDDASYMNTTWSAAKDAGATYSTVCPLPCIVNIPDANFKAALVADAAINTNLDTEIQCAEAAAYTGAIIINSLGISDLTGIEAFTGITELNCNTNNLSSLDVSACISLEILNCGTNLLSNLDVSANTSLTDLFCEYNDISTLDVSANAALTQLICNDNAISTLDVSNNTALLLLNCGANQLSSLNVSLNTALNILYCGNNQISSIDVSANTALMELRCDDNQLNSLNVDNLSNLEYLEFRDNGIANINLSFNPLINYLSCGNNLLSALNTTNQTNLIDLYCFNNPISSLDVSANTLLQQFDCNNTNVGTLDVSNNPNLFFFRCIASGLTSLNMQSGGNINLIDFFATSNPSLSCIQVDDVAYMNTNWGSNKDAVATYSTVCPLPCTVNIPDANFKNYLLADIAINTNSDTEIQCSEASAYNGAIAVNSLGINDLTGIEAFTSITSLNCGSNNLTALDVSSNTALNSLDCNSNQLSSLDVSSNTVLTQLYCYLNLLTNLDGLSNTQLVNLYCFNNQLTSIDVSANTTLLDLWCSENQLTTLDVSTNVMLTGLTCHGNQLTTLDVSANGVLSGIFCQNNQLTSLNIQNGNNSNLTNFNSTNNPLLACIQVDDVSYMNTNWSANKDAASTFSTVCPLCVVNIPDANFKAALIANLAINTNANAEIECTEASAFTGVINVSNLNIADLTGIEAFTAITGLDCFGNLLTSLSLSDLTALTFLDCSFNQLTALDVTANNVLTDFRCYNNQITSLNVSANIALSNLACNTNLLTTLDVSANTALNQLTCGGNLLSTLDVSFNTALTLLYCQGNLLTNIDISNNTVLSNLVINNNQLTALDVSTNTALNLLTCNENQLITLDVSANIALVNLDCNNNLLISLNIANGNNNNLVNFGALVNPSLTCIQVDDVGYMNTNWSAAKDPGASFSLNCACLVNIPDANFKNALLANAAINTNSDGEIQCDEASAFTGSIDVNSLGISDMTGIEAFTGITSLRCYQNNISSGLNVGNAVNLNELLAFTNQLNSIDLTNNVALQFLGLSLNQINTIDLSQNIALTDLGMSNNPISSIDISQNIFLQNITIFSTPLTALDVSNNPNLQMIYCPSNQISSLDLSNNLLLDQLTIYNNNLSVLDVSMLSNLTSFECYLNSLTSLNMQNGNNNNLFEFNITSNPNLLCIQVDDAAFMNTTWSTAKDATATYSAICPLPCVVNIPDANFKAALIANLAINTNANAEIECSEASAFTGIINVDFLGITDLTGIEAFVNITELYCSNNSLTSINITNNTLITRFACEVNQITAIDLSANTLLNYIDVTNNQLTSIDLSNNVQLVDFLCTFNSITSLDFSANPLLELVIAGANPISSVNLTNNPVLKSLTVGGALTSLDLSNLPLLETLSSSGNPLLTSLDFSNNPNIWRIECAGNSLTSLDISGNPNVIFLEVQNNNFSSLNMQNGNNVNFTNLNLTNNPSLTCIQVDDATFMNTNWSAAKDAGATYSTVCPLPCVVNIPDANFKAALIADLAINTNADSEIQCSEASAVNFLYVNGLSIADLTGIEAFTSLFVLDCSDNLLTSLDVSNSPSLFNFYCSNNLLTSLNVNGLTNLNDIIGQDNQLTTLDVSTNTNITSLQLWNNQLTSLDLSNNPNLAQLYCYNNLLTNLNINGATGLSFLVCYGNQLANLDLSNTPSLEQIGCSNNLLTSLDFSNNPLLFNLSCGQNLLTSINVLNNPLLQTFVCNTNQLTSLDVSNNSALTGFICNENQLTSLDVGSLTNLDSLYCRNNLISSLDLSNNLQLTKLSCRVNQLTSLDVAANTSLSVIRCEDNLLTNLNIQNGNNINISQFTATNNLSLLCIQVDDATFMNTNWSAAKDAGATYSTVCPLPCIVNIPDANFKAALIANLTINTNADTEIQCSEASAFNGNINVSSQSINDLTGIEAFVNITGLDCSLNNLNILDVSNNNALINLRCEDNNIFFLNTNNCFNLITLYCYNNNLGVFDVSDNILLKDLYCENTNLVSLDVSNNPELEILAFSMNSISSINLNNNTLLQQLWCYNNSLNTLDLSNNLDLNSLTCFGNGMSTLDLSNNILLVNLSCEDNNLSNLNIQNGNNDNLATFNATNNPSLTCIKVDDVAFMNSTWVAAKDPTAAYSTSCNIVADFVADFTNVCQGSVINFTDLSTGTTGSTTYVWDFGDGNQSTTIGNVSHTYLTDGIFTVSLTITDGISDTKTINNYITILPQPTLPIITLSNNCGNSVLTVSGLTDPFTWTDGNLTNPRTVLSSGAFAVFQTAAGCNSDTAFVFASPLPQPTLPIITLSNNCGNSVLTVSGLTDPFTWTDGDLTNPRTVLSSGAFAVFQTAAGCNSDTSFVFASPLAVPSQPIITLSNNCGNSVLTVSGLTDPFSWTDGDLTNPRTVLSSGTYGVFQTALGCNSDTAFISANPLTVPAPPTLNVVDNCGASVITASGVIGTLNWSDFGAGNPRVETSGSYTATQDVGGCVSAISNSVTANPLPVPSTSLITGNMIPNCAAIGEVYSVTLNAGSDYAWSVPSVAVITSGASGPDNNSITVDFGTINGAITVVETNGSGCTGPSIDTLISLQGCALAANFTANVTTICEGNSVTFTDLSTGTTGSTIYAWNFGNGQVANSSGPHNIQYNLNGSYTVSLTITEGASSTQTFTNYITVNSPSAGTDVQTACDTYTWIDGLTYNASTNAPTFLLTNAAGCDSLVTLNLTINNSTNGTDVQTACDTYTWIDGLTYNASTNAPTFLLTNAAGCDSLVTLNLTINNTTNGTDVQTACDTYTWIDGLTYNASTNTPTFLLTNAAGCDSLVTLNLIINNSTNGTDVQTACDTYTWIDGLTYNASTNAPTFLLTNAAGCDSLVTLNLTINNSTNGTDVQTACDTYTWIDGLTYNASTNAPTFLLTNAAGCDSLVTLNLTINNSTNGTDVQTACDTYTWIDGLTYIASTNTPTFLLTNAAGCDSLVTLNLTINNSTNGTDVQTACDTYTWIDGLTYNASTNTPTFLLTNAAGCDSLVTLNLTINNSTNGTDVQTACDTYTWIDGLTYNASTNAPTFLLTNAAGCDSLVTLNLTINNSTNGTDVQTACDTYTWIDGLTYNASTNAPTFLLTNAAGCDSLVTLNLTINNTTNGTDVQTACDTYTWIDGLTYNASTNAPTFLLTNAAGCDSLVTLNLTINNSTNGTDVQTACDTYTWIDGLTYNASTNAPTFLLTNAAGCDSLVTLNLTINNSTNGTDVQTACDTYTWIDGLTYNASTNAPTFLLTNAAGCDSLVTLNLTINNSTNGTDVQTACDTYTWIDGLTYNASTNTPTFLLTNAAGCDSLVTLNLTINNSTNGTDVQTACDTYTWIDGLTYNASTNAPTFLLTNAAGCDSLVTLNLTINNSTNGTDVQTACDTYTWIDGLTYNASTNAPTFLLTNAAGCDSLVTLNLTINNSTNGTDVQTACDTYTWIDGLTYNASTNTPTFLLTNAAGCDSLVTLNLTINNSTNGTDVQTACDTYTWIDGLTYNASTNAPTFLLTNAAGCDSLVTLNLTINNSTNGTDVQTACDTYTWIDGLTYNASTNAPTFLLTNAAGCDSLVTLNLTINNSTNGTDVQTACDTYTWIDGLTYNASTNAPTFLLTNAAGCDSLVTLNLTINNSTNGTDVQTACDTYTWIDGLTYNASTNAPTFLLTNAAGCDSLVTLNLTINNSTNGTDVQTACDTYTWIDGLTYNASTNAPTFLLTNAAGCDSLVTLNLTINNSTNGTDVQTACDTYTWIDGLTYNASTNTPTFLLTNAAGCDSLVTLNLTINNSTNGTDVQTACDTYTWIDGLTYNASTNTPTFLLTNAAGCDSLVTLNLTINNSTNGTDVQTACDTYTWIDGLTYNASTNAPTFLLTNAAGCDSLVTLNLTINNSTNGTDVQTACDTYTWIDGLTYNASTNAPTFLLTNAAGCDSLVTLNLTINNSTNGTDVQTACNTYTWIDGNTYIASTNAPTFTFVGGSVNGCDSIVTLNLTINNSTASTDVQTACNTYTWIDGNTYIASTNAPTFTFVGGSVNGCDSIVTLNLTINNSTNGTDVQTACNTYTWIDGNTYIASTNAPTFTFVGGSVNGCDSIVTLNLTINNSTNGTDVQTACNTYTWIDGNTYIASTNAPTFTFVGGSVNGCDSIVTLNLTINNSTNGTDVQTACNTYTWIDGNTYIASTNAPIFTFVGGSVNGCDSIVTLNLTINNSTAGTDVQTACDTYTWIDGNTYIASTNAPTFTFVGGSVNGCDSIVTLNLTINITPTAPILAVVDNCGSSDVTASNVIGTLIWSDFGTGNPRNFLTPITLTVTQDLAGCISTTSNSVTTNPLGVTSIVNTLTNETCGLANGSYDVTAVTGGTAPFNYSLDGVTYVATSLFGGLTAGAYTVFVQDANNCIYSEPFNINNTGGVTAISNNLVDATCGLANGSYDITGITGGTAPYTYSIDGVTYGGTTSFVGLAAGPYTIYVQDNNNCVYSEPFTINTSVIPITSVITGNTNPICNELGVNFSVVLTAGSSYTWSTPVGSLITNGATGLDNNTITVDLGSTNGNIDVTETNAAGCVGATQSLAITLQGCGLAANYSADVDTICEGASVTFTDLSTGTTGSTTYFWDFGAGAIPATAAGQGPHVITYIVPGAATVSLTVTDGIVSTLSNPNFITINTVLTPSVSISVANSTICGPTVLDFTSNVINGGLNPTYQWQLNGVDIVGANADSLNINTLVETDSISLNVISNETCLLVPNASSNQIAIIDSCDAIITTLPVALNAYCAGSSLTVNYIVNGTVNSNNVFIAQMSDALGSFASPTNIGQIVATTSGTIPAMIPLNTNTGLQYRIRVVSNSPGISGSDNGADIAVNTVNFGVSFGITNLNLASLPMLAEFNNTTPNLNQYSFTWFFGDGSQEIINDATVNYTYNYNGSYNVSLVATDNATGCTQTIYDTLNTILCSGLSTNPCNHAASINAPSVINGCAGSQLNLSVNNFNSAFSYQWHRNGAAINGGNYQTLTINTSGFYSVTVFDIAGCPKTSSPVQVSFNLPAVTPPEIAITGLVGNCGQINATLNTNGNFASYLWNTGASADSINITQAGVYTVIGQGALGCDATSQPFAVSSSFLPAPTICMVTVDTLTNHHLLMWEKPVSSQIQSFAIYKEIPFNSNNYQQIAILPYDSLSEYLDINSDAAQVTDRYRLSFIDTCNGETSYSDFVRAIGLKVFPGVGVQRVLSWNSYTGAAQNITSYLVYSGPDYSNMNIIATVLPGALPYIDSNPIAGTNTVYRVQTELSQSCESTRAIRNRSASNGTGNLIVSYPDTTTAISSLSAIKYKINILPNPNNGAFIINWDKSEIAPGATVWIESMYGQKVTSPVSMTENNTAISIDVKSGVYFVKVNSMVGEWVTRVVIVN